MTEDRNVSRRGTICGIALLALGGAPESALAATGVKVLASGKVEISLAANSALKKVGGVVTFQDANYNSLALVRISKAKNGYRALNLACTHQKVIVEQEGNNWRCRRGHGAEYKLDGTVKVGPATRNLLQLPIKVSATKVVVG